MASSDVVDGVWKPVLGLSPTFNDAATEKRDDALWDQIVDEAFFPMGSLPVLLSEEKSVGRSVSHLV